MNVKLHLQDKNTKSAEADELQQKNFNLVLSGSLKKSIRPSNDSKFETFVASTTLVVGVEGGKYLLLERPL